LTGSQLADHIASEARVGAVWWTDWRQTALGGLDQRGAAAGQALLGVEDFDPGSEAAVQASRGLLIGEASQPTQMAPIGAGYIAAMARAKRLPIWVATAGSQVVALT
jgi:hypothetical protein